MIDWKQFSTYLGGYSKNQDNDIIDTFIQSYPGIEAKLRSAVLVRDHAVVEDLSHQLKTNCYWFGASSAGDLALQLEMIGKKLQEGDMIVVLSQFETAVKEMIQELSKYRETLVG